MMGQALKKIGAAGFPMKILTGRPGKKKHSNRHSDLTSHLNLMAGLIVDSDFLPMDSFVFLVLYLHRWSRTFLYYTLFHPMPCASSPFHSYTRKVAGRISAKIFLIET